PEQRHLPVFRRWLDLEDRTAVAGHDLAGEDEAAGIDFGRTGGVRGAQVVRRDDQAVGAAGPKPRQRDRSAAGARHYIPRETAHDQRRNASALCDRHALPWWGGTVCLAILLVRKRGPDTLSNAPLSARVLQNLI